jgi:hypothetical protein
MGHYVYYLSFHKESIWDTSCMFQFLVPSASWSNNDVVSTWSQINHRDWYENHTAEFGTSSSRYCSANTRLGIIRNLHCLPYSSLSLLFVGNLSSNLPFWALVVNGTQKTKFNIHTNESYINTPCTFYRFIMRNNYLFILRHFCIQSYNIITFSVTPILFLSLHWNF